MYALGLAVKYLHRHKSLSALIQVGTDVNEKKDTLTLRSLNIPLYDDNFYPIEVATWFSDSRCIRILLNAGANVTPLVVKILVAKPNPKVLCVVLEHINKCRDHIPQEFEFEFAVMRENVVGVTQLLEKRPVITLEILKLIETGYFKQMNDIILEHINNSPKINK